MKWPQIFVIVWICYEVSTSLHAISQKKITFHELGVSVERVKQRTRLMQNMAKVLVLIEHTVLVMLLWWGGFW